MPDDPDLRISRGLFANLGLPETAASVDAMLSATKLTWDDLDAFLRCLERESAAKRPAVKEAFQSMERVLMTALGETKARRRDIIDLARAAPPLDEPMQRLARVFPTIHDALSRLGKSGDVEASLLAALLGHVVRMQILSDVVHPWVKHWGQGLENAARREAVHFLLMLRFAVGPEGQRVPDTTAYRNAVAHGHFQVKGHQARFWHHDRQGDLIVELPALTSGDILNLYDLVELRLRGIESFTRTVTGWARHADIPGSDGVSETPIK
jgi:hypothetical protein